VRVTGALLDFTLRVASGFNRSQGLLLSGAVAYYTLLSIVPLFMVLLVGLSHLVDERRLLDTVASNLQLVIPGQATVVTQQVENLPAHRGAVGIVGLPALLFFSSAAFAVVESAMAVIFSGALHAVQAVRVFGYTWPAAGLSGAMLYLLDMGGHVLLLTALYMVLPVGQVRFGYALIGVSPRPCSGS
jgi:membrane protein